MNTSTAINTPPQSLPEGFVYLEQVDSTIAQEIRYAMDDNFVGRPIDGYEAHRCVVTTQIAERLSRAQKELQTQGLELKVYEGYRPLRAGIAFVKWAQDTTDQTMKEHYYPNVDKDRVFDLGYISMRSQHTRGCAVDLTITKDGQELDMGTPFDWFDERSHTANPNIPEEAKRNRQMLLKLMDKHGFANYSKEWWHFYLKDEPFPHTYFDFPIV